MRTKQFFYLCGILCLVCCATLDAKAQVVVEEVTVAEVVSGKPHYYSESNLDNWYLSIGAGTQTYLTEHNNSDAHFTLAMNMAVGKWITPFVGMRMSAMGGSLHYDWIAPQKSQYNYGSMRYGAFYVDFLWEMLNTVAGYSERRVISIIPFIGLGGAYGWHHDNNMEDTWAMPVTGGLKLNFRLGHYVDLFFEGRVQAVADQFNRVNMGSQIETAISVIGGLSFKFRESRFKAFDPYIDQLAIAELNRRTNQLRAALQECQSRKIECPPCPEVTPPAPIVEKVDCCEAMTASVSFAINSATVSQREMVNVYNVAHWLKDNPNCKVTITGYADRNTGTAEYNMKLSKHRAEAVAEALKATYGIASDRIIVKSEGSGEQPYPADNNWNRVVIIVGSEL
ncbi:MAG: OmpA family protein [Bacteroidaceae bacterium]|nr:OmpA family protein [Bacteroidaceae bacterium]